MLVEHSRKEHLAEQCASPSNMSGMRLLVAKRLELLMLLVSGGTFCQRTRGCC